MYTPTGIATIVSGVIWHENANDQSVQYLLTDSRQLIFAEKTIFFALKTLKNDGHKYIPELLQKGVKTFVVSDELVVNFSQNATFIKVDDTLDALQKLVTWHRNRFHLEVTGITGSNGKTIVKEWLSQLLAPDCYLVKNPRSYNSQTGVPLSVWQIEEGHELGLFEAGISTMGEMNKLQPVINPQWGIFTNIGPAHDEGFPDRKTKILEKLKLFSNAKVLIYRNDDHLLHETIMHWATNHDRLKLFSWGQKEEGFLCIRQVHNDHNGFNVELEINKGDRINIFLPFSDNASFENAMHCVVYLLLKGYRAEETEKRVLKLYPVSMRMEMLKGNNGCQIINDAYNSDALSLRIALDFLEKQIGRQRKTVILSDILQSGMNTHELYKQTNDLLLEAGICKLIAIGDQISSEKEVFQIPEQHFYSSTDDFLAHYHEHSFIDEGILLKGARQFGFEQISGLLQHNDHQTLLEINLDALIHNLNIYRSMLPEGVKTMAMVKAFGYGSGSYEIARVLQYHRVDYLAVAFADEGKQLRNAGIRLPIVVLNPEVNDLDVLFRFNLEPEVYSFSLLNDLDRKAGEFFRGQNVLFPVHLKIDTGMHRMGFTDDDVNQLAHMLPDIKNLKVASVFSHFAASDMPEFDDFSKQQYEAFRQISKNLQSKLDYTFLKHICNSAAISRFPFAHENMVRVGIGLYGIDPTEKVKQALQNVVSFKSVISQVKMVKPGETVGYNRSGVVDRDTLVAIVPVGYADGLRRSLVQQGGYLLVNGHKAPFIGNISMDMCAIDVTGINVKPGDPVTIFGEGQPVEKLARQMNTIPYEILTSVDARVKRVYFQE